jgi:prepilin-type N-terminal cleavage/methylation domain-containing protein
MKKAFTLTEVLVVIFIVGLLSTILVVNWRNNEKAYLVQRTAQEIAQNFRTVQDMALAGKIFGSGTGPCFSSPCYSYGINFDTSKKNNYINFGDRNNNNTYQEPPSDLSIETITIDSNVEIYSLSPVLGNFLNIVFSVPDGFVTINNNSGITSAVIKIRKVGTTCTQKRNCKTITITKTGEINIE